MIRRVLPTLGLLYLVACVFGFWGYATHAWRIFPYDVIVPIRDALLGGEGPDKPFWEKMLAPVQEKENCFDYHGFVVRDTQFVDDGYLLMARYSGEHGQVVVDLRRVAGFELVHRWVPPIAEIIKRGNRDEPTGKLNVGKAEFRVQHPLLLEDGGIVFGHGEGYLARIDRDSRVRWVNSHHFHHSIEKLIDGNLVVNININPPSADYGWRDDGYAVVSLDGEILETHSVTKILQDNGYGGLLTGMCRNRANDDCLHFNDAQPIFEDKGLAKRGDLALSIRNPNIVAIYRPGDNEIVALQFGPWVQQHDVNILADGRFSIFNNFKFKGGREPGRLSSNVMIWDPVKGSVESPYDAIFDQADLFTETGGRSRILPNGDVYVEETERHRLLRVAPDGIRWEYVNVSDGNPDLSGAVHWCRYYLPEEISLGWLEKAR
jgi:hypothetical protein